MVNNSLNYERKFLTVCQGGQVRSVGMKFALTYRFKVGQAIAVGVEANSPDFIKSLSEQVDLVIVMDRTLCKSMPEGVKYIVCDVGPDNFGNPFHSDLQAKIDGWIIQNASILNGNKSI